MMKILKYVRIWLIMRSEHRAAKNFKRLLHEIAHMKKQSHGLGTREIGDLPEKLPLIEALIKLSRFELFTSNSPLRGLDDAKEARKKLEKATGLRCPKCCP